MYSLSDNDYPLPLEEIHLKPSKIHFLRTDNENSMTLERDDSCQHSSSVTGLSVKLSPYHEIFYNEWKLNPQRSDYNIVIDNELWGAFDPLRLDQALQRLSQDYFLLQSCVVETEEGYYWESQPGLSIGFEYVEAPQSDAALLAYVNAAFDLRTGPLLRVRLIKLAEEHFRLIIVIHHLIMDGAKVSFIGEAVPHYYNDSQFRFNLNIREQCQKLDELSKRLARQLTLDEANHTEFWRKQLTDLPGIDLRFLKTSPRIPLDPNENAVGECLFTFDAETLQRVQKAARKYQITPYILSQVIFSTLLHRHTGQEKFGLCFPIAIPEGADFIYGTHISPVIIPYQFSPSVSLKTVIEHTKIYFKAVKANRHHYLPLQKLLLTFANKDTVAVAFTQTNLKNQSFNFVGTTNEKVHTSLNIDLAGKLLLAQEIKGQQIFYRALYKKQDIDADLLLNFLHTYQRLLPEIVADLLDGPGDRPVSDYNLLTAEQYQLLTQKWNQTDQSYRHDQTLHQLFEEQVVKTPGAIAVAYEGVSLTYSALNQQANQLAHYIRGLQIQPGDLISLCVHPSHNMIVALWAVLKAGAAYVPVNPVYPDDRITYILKDTKAKLLLADQALLNRLAPICQAQTVTLLAVDNQSAWGTQPITNPTIYTSSRDLAYVIYTSGTQGQPKGVLVEHSSVVNYVTYLIAYNQLSETSIGAKYAAFSFDCSVTEIYPILLSGGKLCVIKEKDCMDCRKVNDFFHLHAVTYAFLPTPFAEQFYELENTSLKNLMVGGSKLNRYVASSYRINNVYGPTEATVQTTIFSLCQAYDNIPIGKPLDNVKCYVVDTCFNLLPVGAIGELLIGGEGLARQYLNRPDLTAEKFISNPFQSKKEKNENKNLRLYRSGDLARWLPDGNLEYIGRNDEQVKIRGHRIELGEIEYKLLQYSGIQQAAVVAVDKAGEFAEKQLAAFYLALTPLDSVNLKNYLLTQLPEYMVPVIYIHLDKLPLSSSGKIDKSALSTHNWDSALSYTAPNNFLEQVVCGAYAHTLGLGAEEVGVHHDFFELGGDSISAIRLTFSLEHHFKINVTDIFKLKTPANLVSKLPPATENFLQKTEQIRLFYQNKATFGAQDLRLRTTNQDICQQYEHYVEQVKQLNPDITARKNIRSVLLTGATGFLGCHLLASLLAETPYTIYLPVRASSDEAAFGRLNQKFQYYFENGLENNASRIKVFAAHLNKTNLDLEQEQYDDLLVQVDSIIHCASLVKYYGHDEEFYQSNIQPTINLLELAKLTATKDFHYISTIGVPLDGHVPNRDYVIFTEEDDLNKLVRGNHPYIQSKYQAEQLVNQYRLQGVNGSIYRIGNLVMHSQTYRIQENFEENMFFAQVKALVNFSMTPKEIAHMEVSPVDCTAKAIVKLFDKMFLSNQTYHVFNPKICNIQNVLAYFMNLEKQDCAFKEFVGKVASNIKQDEGSAQSFYLFMLYQFWLYTVDSNHTTTIRLEQQKTEHILAKLGFRWPVLTPVMFRELINKVSFS